MNFQAIKVLTTSTTIEVNALNANGLTALDILPQIKGDEKDSEIIELLGRASAISARDEGKKKKKKKKTKTPSKSHVNNDNLARQDEYDWLRKKRSTLMVVASLIATMAFQVGANPPGGLWQDNFVGDAKTPAHNAGSSILADLSPEAYGHFLTSNSIAFVTALSIILLLVSGLPIRSRILMWVLMVIMWVAITAIAVTYLLSMSAFTPAHQANTYASVIGYVILVWIGLCAILFFGHTIRLMVRIIKFIRKLIRRQRRRSSSSPSSSSGSMLVNHRASAASNLGNLNNV